MADYSNPFIDIVRTNEEINKVYDRSYETNYHGMTYEQGVRAMYEWLVGGRDDAPVEFDTNEA